MKRAVWYLVGWVFWAISITDGKIHHLELEDDIRSDIEITNFGYVMQGSIQVQITNLSLVIDYCNDKTTSKEFTGKVGFTLSQGDEVPELLRSTNECLLDERFRTLHQDWSIVYFVFDLDNHVISVDRTGNLENMELCRHFKQNTEFCKNRNSYVTTTQTPRNISTLPADEDHMRKKREDDVHIGIIPKQGDPLPTHCVNKTTLYDTSFAAHFWKKEEEGMFYLIFHNCHNLNKPVQSRIGVDLIIDVIEKNENSYLQAGEVVKPTLYFILATLFFVTGIAWVHLIKANKNGQIFKIHYLMTALVFLKSLSLLCHGINFYCISIYGHQQEVWAVLYYFMHLVKGALLFGVIILIGTGWTFFKNFLTERDRKLFMLIVPLQVLDNLALIIIEESEQGTQNYRFWMQIFIFIDLICCAAIILPIIWSIRHLQEASSTDGKAAFNLEKLKLFRHFYIIVICYIYLTRIIKYLVVFTVPFRYIWLVVVVEELGTWVFFVVTGYQFKPAMNNPYLKLAQSDEDSETEALTQSGVLDGVTRIKRAKEVSGVSCDVFDPDHGVSMSDIPPTGNARKGTTSSMGEAGPDLEAQI